MKKKIDYNFIDLRSSASFLIVNKKATDLIKVVLKDKENNFRAFRYINKQHINKSKEIYDAKVDMARQYTVALLSANKNKLYLS